MAKAMDIYGGRKPAELPLYDLATAARIVRMPPATLRTWGLGRNYEVADGPRRFHPLIKPADKRRKRLSFKNLVELQVLSTLRNRHIRVDRIRKATKFIREKMGTEHPLADADTQVDHADVYVEYIGMLLNASEDGQRVWQEALEKNLTRIERDEQGIARRLFPVSRHGADLGPSMVVIDPARRFGRPMLDGTGVETATLADRFQAGESAGKLAKEFDVSRGQVEEAVRFETLLRAS